MKSNVTRIYPEDIEIDKMGGQVRTSGIDSNHIYDLKASIEKKGQKKAIKIEYQGRTPVCVDGQHRVEAMKLINKGLPPSQRMKIEAEILKGLNTQTRLLVQIQSNSHDPTRNNSFKDIVAVVKKLVKEENVIVGLNDFKTDKEKIDRIRDYVVTILPNEKHRARKIAVKVYSELPKSVTDPKITNYLKSSAIDHFNEHNPFSAHVEGSGRADNNKVFYFVDKENEFNTVFGQACVKKDKYPGVEIHLVSWLGNADGKTPTDVRSHRTRFETLAKNRNHWVRAQWDEKKNKLFETISFLPQILQDKSISKPEAKMLKIVL